MALSKGNHEIEENKVTSPQSHEKSTIETTIFENDSSKDIESNRNKTDGASSRDTKEHSSQTPRTATDLVTEVIHAEDDSTLNPWTFRVWFIGIGLSIFGGLLATIYYFKPQSVVISSVFLAVISYILGEVTSKILPSKGIIGKLLNPHSFNSKEHAAMIVMGSAAANAPYAMEMLAVLKLYYKVKPNPIVSILLLWSSQCIGYGFAGLMRRTLVYPTKMLFPYNLPLTSMLEALHGDKKQVAKKLRVFKIGFIVLFLYELFPAYIMPILVGVSVICLSHRNDMFVTHVFGGSNNNEGMGVLQWSFDWQYIANPSPLWYPLQTLTNNFVGYILCIFVFIGVYYGNVWNAQNFPFLSQALFTKNSNGTYFEKYNQTNVLNNHTWTVEPDKVAEIGLPWLTATFTVYILATNLSVTATFSHLMLWNYDDIKGAWKDITIKNVVGIFNPRKWAFWKQDNHIWGGENDTETDPHYRLMLIYKDSPNWWYGLLLVLSLCTGMAGIYLAHSTLPWWSFLIATLVLSPFSILFFGAQFAITGFQYNVQTMVQMLAGYLHPGRPMANMYFVLFGYNSVVQSQLLLRDLKFAQYAHLPPRTTFTMQLVGTTIGSTASYLMMSSITTAQAPALLSLQGTPLWSGANLQTFNSQALAWGAFARPLFAAGARYQWASWALLIGLVAPLPLWLLHRCVPRWRLDYWNVALIANYVGLLNSGISSVTMPWFVIGAFAQGWLRRYRPRWFVKYNYVLSAAMEGGTQLLVFILSFAVFGGAGNPVRFPPWFGNRYNQNDVNLDFCMRNPATDAAD